MSRSSNRTPWGWRLLWGAVGGGLAFTVLSVSGFELSLPVALAISGAVAVAVAMGGPALLELLNLV